MKNNATATKRALLLCVIFLAGCSGSIPGYQVDSFVKQCASRGGIHAIDTRIIPDAICRDGSRVQFERAAR